VLSLWKDHQRSLLSESVLETLLVMMEEQIAQATTKHESYSIIDLETNEVISSGMNPFLIIHDSCVNAMRCSYMEHQGLVNVLMFWIAVQ